MSEIFDISQTLENGMPIWPGDTEFHSSWVMKLAAGESVNLGSVTMSLHSGTHADAPLHFLAEGSAMDECALSIYVGKAIVVDATDSDRILERHLAGLKPNDVERVLFKTRNEPQGKFSDEFSYFSLEAVRAIGRLAPVLVGTDSPSVDRFDSKTLDAHNGFATHGIAILENLRLHHIEPGEYELIALPLRLVGMDASPVRAILRR
ncbi:cyclase family protein [Gemmatimonas aurantiaca]|nr:cyclase family protein [Gemmatimonas aurantiaca]